MLYCGEVCSLNDPWCFAASHCFIAFYVSVCLELIAALCDGAKHYSNPVGAILSYVLY